MRLAEAYPEFATQLLVDDCNPNPNVVRKERTITNEDGTVASTIVTYEPGGDEEY